MIIGTGVDMVRISRVRGTYARFGERFLRRVFTEIEIAYCLRKRDPIPSLAARFAVKEACFKALGGTRRPAWRDIEVVNGANGKPSLRLHGRMAAAHREYDAHVAITHDGDYAMATVVAELRSATMDSRLPKDPITR